MTNSSKSSARIGSRSGIAALLAVWLAHGAEPVLAAPENVTPTVEQDFNFHCAACHGTDGKGDGPVADLLKIQPPDLTRIAERNGGIFSEDAVFETIAGGNMPLSHGTREMPIWGNLFIGETLDRSVSVEEAQEAVAEATDRIKRLVKYLHTIQTAE